MYLEEVKTKSTSGKIHSCFLLRESRREGKKTIKTTLANISHLPDDEIKAIRQALRYKTAGVTPADVRLSAGKIVGALHVFVELVKRVGISDVLGSSRFARLSLWLIFARLIEQGSRLSSVRLAQRHETSILELGQFDEDDLYKALDWLAERQEAIEQALFERRYKEDRPSLFLYDVTSSYFEGWENDLSWWGYNRDGKKGKMQIVFGLLADGDGEPIAVEVFEGNTSDQATFVVLVRNFGERFGVKKVTLIGDRGMIKSVGIDELHKHELSYITAITKPQIRTLLKDGVIQLELFDKDLCEVDDNGIRYVLKRNPRRAAEVQAAREDKLEKLRERCQAETEYLKEHPHAAEEKAAKRLEEVAKRLVLGSLVTVVVEERRASLQIIEDEWSKARELDGCYVLKTDIPKDVLSKEKVHDRYKDLAKVERGFRTIKTGLLEVRPIWLRRGNRTRAHVFVCMLAYLVARQIDKILDEEETVSNALQQLCGIAAINMVVGDTTVPTIPVQPAEVQSLLERLKVVIPNHSSAPRKTKPYKTA
jgi:transposase